MSGCFFSLFTDHSSPCLCCSVHTGPTGRSLLWSQRCCTLFSFLRGSSLCLVYSLTSVICLLKCHPLTGIPYPWSLWNSHHHHCLSFPLLYSFLVLNVTWCYLVIVLSCDMCVPKSYHAMRNCTTGFTRKMFWGTIFKHIVSDMLKREEPDKNRSMTLRDWVH